MLAKAARRAITLLGLASASWGGDFDLGIAELDEHIVFLLARDAIPALTNPVLLSAEEATLRASDRASDPRAYVADNDRVIGVVRDGVSRAYPVNLGWWHEIINDRLGDSFIAVTYCPFTDTGLVFDVAKTDGTQGELGVSGMLINSNLVMYDRRDDRSIFPQMTYIGLTGEYRDRPLELLPAVETTWSLWKRLYPDTTVPQTGTGLERYSQRIQDNYGDRIDLYRASENGYPYGAYRTDERLYFPVIAEPDLTRFHAKEVVLGICHDGQSKAYPFSSMAVSRVINDRVGNLDIVVLYDPESQTAIPYDRLVDNRRHTFHLVTDPQTDQVLAFADVETGSHWNLLGEAVTGPLTGKRLRQVPAYSSMWFAWNTFWPASEIWDGEGVVEAPTTAVSGSIGEGVPTTYALAQNVPNPFNSSTLIEYQLMRAGHVLLTIYDPLGRRVRILEDRVIGAGTHVRVWNGRDDAGRPVASGVYRYQLSLPAAGVERSLAMTLVR